MNYRKIQKPTSDDYINKYRLSFECYLENRSNDSYILILLQWIKTVEIKAIAPVFSVTERSATTKATLCGSVDLCRLRMT